jgi:SAM-dependent methyltransferase
VANPYYRTGDSLKTKNLRAGGMTIDIAERALAHLDLATVRRALDAGCGWGRFAVPLLRAAPPALQLTVCDVWPGMVGTCAQTLADADVVAERAAADVRRLPFRDATFDLAMANHMLYELDDDGVAHAVDELARVVTDDGTLVATTYSDRTPVPLVQLHHFAVGSDPAQEERASSFSLENGGDVLRRGFATVEVDVVEEVNTTTDADELVEVYLKTGRHESVPVEDRPAVAARFRTEAQRRIDAHGAILGTTRWAVFVASCPHVRPRPR